MQFLLMKWNQASLPFRQGLTEMGLTTVVHFSELLFLQNWEDIEMQIKPDATRRFLFLSILQLFSFLVPSAKLPTSEPYGFVSIRSEAASWSDSGKGDKPSLVANTEWNNKNTHEIHLLWMYYYIKYSQPGTKTWTSTNSPPFVVI